MDRADKVAHWESQFSAGSVMSDAVYCAEAVYLADKAIRPKEGSDRHQEHDIVRNLRGVGPAFADNGVRRVGDDPVNRLVPLEEILPIVALAPKGAGYKVGENSAPTEWLKHSTGGFEMRDHIHGDPCGSEDSIAFSVALNEFELAQGLTSASDCEQRRT